MATIDFPNSPTVGDLFTAGSVSYRWTGVVWISNNLGSIDWDDVTDKPATFPPSAHTHVIADITNYDRTAGTVLSDTAPASPVAGLRWINTTNLIEYVYYNSTWVEV
jgi:hypothetical protein